MTETPVVSPEEPEDPLTIVLIVTAIVARVPQAFQKAAVWSIIGTVALCLCIVFAFLCSLVGGEHFFGVILGLISIGFGVLAAVMAVFALSEIEDKI